MHRFSVKAIEEQGELDSLITTEDTYQTSDRTGIIKDKWNATLSKSSYHGVAVCVADPCACTAVVIDAVLCF